MKYLTLLCLLSGCSLIKINEGPLVPKRRPEFIQVTEEYGGKEFEIRVRVSDIDRYWDDSGKCVISIPHENITTTSECGEIDAILSR